MYQIVHRKIGYIVIECETIEEARIEWKSYGKRTFMIIDENGNQVK